jgi:hypothetical protein
MLYLELGRLTEAERWLREARVIWEIGLPPTHWKTARVRGALGVCLLEKGAVEEAEPLLRGALETLRAKLGPGHPFTKTVAEGLPPLE